MELKRFHISFKTVVSEAKSELKSHVSLLCADHGYYIDNLTLFLDDTGLMPGVRVALRPTSSYDEQALSELEAALENDLNNIVFDYVYNSRNKISAEDSSTVMCISHISECISQLVLASQN
jgi:formyltetrahydrofolate hydrolase